MKILQPRSFACFLDWDVHNVCDDDGFEMSLFIYRLIYVVLRLEQILKYMVVVCLQFIVHIMYGYLVRHV